MQRTYFDTKLQKDPPLFFVVVLLAISVSLVAPAKIVYAENAGSQEHSQLSAPTPENTSQSTQNSEASPSHGTKPSGDSQADNAAPLNGAAQTNANTESSAANQNNAQNGASSSLEKSGDPSQPSTSESSEASAPDSPKPTSGWEKCAEGFRYKDENGSYLKNWFKDSDGWHFFNAAGIAARGWAYTTNNDIFYFDPSQEHHPALLGEVTLNGGRHYYFDEHSGLAQDRWVKLPGGNWVYASKEGAFISGWHYIGGNKIFYFDTEDPTHPALFGEVVLNGGRHYWFDENQGMASNQWVTLANGKRVWATAEGSLAESDAKDAKLITDAPSGDTEKPDDNNTPDKPSDDPSDKPSDKPSEVTWSTETTILGEASLSKDALVADLKAGLAARGISYPKELAEKSAATPEEFVDQLWDAATAEGVRPEVLYAQAMLETGYLQFNGDVSAGQCNFGGMGATGNGVPGDSYKNVHEGLLAQAQHLRVYTGNTPLTSIVDKRFGDWLLNRQKANPATTIGKLVGSWAMSPTYADQIVSILNRL
ncbi:MAG: glucosaminidase domain-containing protein [Lancefieldella rimae]|uniref:Glucosaminidase domain-containing protein n=2 Tax=Lancefieldella rimae TaxID=1383 RepID=A0A930YRW3_9ACTN|nr:glucosaminidase domain-containing protein [Lancefieldella rimae]